VKATASIIVTTLTPHVIDAGEYVLPPFAEPLVLEPVDSFPPEDVPLLEQDARSTPTARVATNPVTLVRVDLDV
jgi:hypothetical protein